MMTSLRVLFTFPAERIKEPVIFNLGQRFRIVTNIRRADVTDDHGWVVLELDGDEQDIEAGLEWIRGLGVRADPMEGDVIAG